MNKQTHKPFPARYLHSSHVHDLLMRSAHKTSVFYKLLMAAVIAGIALAVVIQFMAGNNGDKEMFFYSSRQLLAGSRLYQDIFTINMPLIHYVYMLPVYLARQFPVMQDYHFLALLGLATVIYVVFIALQLIRCNTEFALCPKKQFEFCLLMTSVFLFFQSPAYFFDRDYLFLVLIYPYILRWMPSVSNQTLPVWLRLSIGLMAGIGFCFKPWCFIVFAAIQLLYGWREWAVAILWSLENSLIYTITAAYMVSIQLLTPDYFTVVVPMALATYAATNGKLLNPVYFSFAVLNLGIIFSDFRLRHFSPYRRDILYLLALCLPFSAYALANNGWAYCWNVLFAHILVLNGFVLWEFAWLVWFHQSQGLPFRQFIFGKRACIINLAVNAGFMLTILVPLLFQDHHYFGDEAGKYFLQTIVRNNDSKPLQSFGAISLDFLTWPNLVKETGAKWQTRFIQVWMLPKFFVSDQAFAVNNRWIPEYIGNGYAEDLAKNRPEIVFVDSSDYFYTENRQIDLLFYLYYSAAFTREWQHYTLSGEIESVSDLEEKLAVTGRIDGNRKKKHYYRYFVYKRIPSL